MSEAIRRCEKVPETQKNHDETTRYLASRYNGGLHFVTSQPSGVKHILVHEQDYI